MKLSRILFCAVALLAVPSLRAADQPGKTIELVAAGAPGGGLDLVARALDAGLRERKLIPETILIKNMGGAGGNLAKTYVHQKKGDPWLLYLESNRIYLNRIVGTTHLNYTDFVPIGRVMTEYLVWVVRADSPYKSAKDILAKLKANPASIVFGVGTLPGNDQMNILRPARASGVDAKKVQIVTFKAGGDLAIQLLGGHVPVISTGLSEILEHVKAGKARLIAVSAPSPVGGELAKVPTWRSMGINVAILHWRGLFAPPGTRPEVVKYWDKTLSTLVKTDTWKKTLQRHEWFDAYADSATFLRELEQEEKVYAEILTELGMAKQSEKK